MSDLTSMSAELSARRSAREAHDRSVLNLTQELGDASRAVPAPGDVSRELLADVRQHVDLIALRRLQAFIGRVLEPTVVPLHRGSPDGWTSPKGAA